VAPGVENREDGRGWRECDSDWCGCCRCGRRLRVMLGLTLGGTPSGVSAAPVAVVVVAEAAAAAKLEDKDPPEVERATNPSGSVVS
jgi:hypothetical protein